MMERKQEIRQERANNLQEKVKEPISVQEALHQRAQSAQMLRHGLSAAMLRYPLRALAGALPNSAILALAERAEQSVPAERLPDLFDAQLQPFQPEEERVFPEILPPLEDDL